MSLSNGKGDEQVMRNKDDDNNIVDKATHGIATAAEDVSRLISQRCRCPVNNHHS
jgi:hypothetical protein